MIVKHEQCSVCGSIGNFTIPDGATLFREAVCESCGASIRHSDVANSISQNFSNGAPICKITDDLQSTIILNTASLGAIHEQLECLPNYFYSEYFSDISSGERTQEGVLCVDLCNIPFEDETFDLIVTEDVLEYVENYQTAFSEIARALKVGGKHIFTVPICENVYTRRTVSSQPVCHPAPNGEKLHVYTEFGFDIVDLLSQYNFVTTFDVMHRFYADDDVTDLHRDYQRYIEFEADLLNFYKYNSIVFISEKAPQSSVAERLDPESNTNIETETEHLHRYHAVREMARGKVVLDAACGMGYGSKILADVAKKVIGIDIDHNTIGNLNQMTNPNNLEYMEMSIAGLNFPPRCFDLVVSFETIEHVNEHLQNQFLCEIQRVLKDDGILIISTPNTNMMQHIIKNYNNPFHIKEFAPPEFERFLREYFKEIKFFRQNYLESSLITPLVRAEIITDKNSDISKYLIAVCSNRTINGIDLGGAYYPSIGVYYDRLHEISYTFATLYVNSGSGFNEREKERISCEYNYGHFRIQFQLHDYPIITALRFDLLEGKNCRIRLNGCNIDGCEFEMNAPYALFRQNGFYYFYDGDPAFVLEGDFNGIQTLTLEGFVGMDGLIKPLYEMRNFQQDLNQEYSLLQNQLEIDKQKIALLVTNLNEQANTIDKLTQIDLEKTKIIEKNCEKLARIKCENSLMQEQLTQKDEENGNITANNFLMQEQLTQKDEEIENITANNFLMQEQLTQKDQEIEKLLKINHLQQKELESSQEYIRLICISFSWRITKPLRILRAKFKEIFGR